MSDDSTRPAKRVRLDGCADCTLPPSDSTPKPLASTTTTATATAIDHDSARELRAGITEYVCPHNPGFTGILKQRYTDFLVNEIGLDGEVVRLRRIELETAEIGSGTRQEHGGGVKTVDGDATNIGEEKKAREHNGTPALSEAQNATAPNHQPDEEINAEQQTGTTETELLQSDRSALEAIFGENVTNQILTLVRQIRRQEHKKARDFKVILSAPIVDKETRTQAHKSLRRIFPGVLESVMEENQSIRIKAIPPAERKGRKKSNTVSREREDRDSGRQRGRPAWDELGGEYLHFSLYKENKDTMEVVGFLGSKLNCGAKGFGFAGTKDRRACTVQRVCVKRHTAERMQSFNKILYHAAVGDFAYRSENLKLGDLMGNEFTITLRDCHFQNEEGLDWNGRTRLANEVLKKAIGDFSEKGFVNYYGLQRFGSFATSTDVIGRKMLQNDLKGAVEDLLDYSEVALAAAQGRQMDSVILISQDDRDRANALHTWRTERSSSAALSILPKKFHAERNIIQHLGSRNSKTGQRDRAADWQGALMAIPRNLRLMYVHAYQSLVWNTLAGMRWVTYGNTVVEGDLVLVDANRNKKTDPQHTTAKHQDQDGEFVIHPTGVENANDTESSFERARPLTAAEASSGIYSIWDIVLPQPGYDVEYPNNKVGDFYKEFMGSEAGGGLDPHSMRRSWREISLSGGYRKLLSRPLQPLSFQVHQYTRYDQQFVETDLERLKRTAKTTGESQSCMETKDGEEKEGEERIAVVITLQLASSQYATMALRELMKAGGAQAFQPEFMGGR